MESITVRKLRIFAILIRLQEMEVERLAAMDAKRRRAFEPEPLRFTAQPRLTSVDHLFDKRGRLFQPERSKYHKWSTGNNGVSHGDHS